MPSQFATVGSLIDNKQKSIAEVLGKTVEIVQCELDPVARSAVNSTRGVISMDRLGRDYKVMRHFKTGFTGVIEMGNQTNDMALYGDATRNFGPHAIQNRITKTWPNPLDGMKQRDIRFAAGLKCQLTNLLLTMGELRLDATPANIEEIVTPIFEGFGAHMAHTNLNYFYLNQNTNYALGSMKSGGALNAGDVIVDTTAKTITFVVREYVTERFWYGQRVDVMADAGSGVAPNSTRINSAVTTGARIECIVSIVDEATGKVTLQYDPDLTVGGSDGNIPANLGLTTGTVYWVVYAGTLVSSTYQGMHGINNWLKGGNGGNDNYLLGADRDTNNQVSVVENPWLKSIVWPNVGQLTEHWLRMYIRRAHSSKKRYGISWDTVICSDGILSSYEATLVGQYTRERSGRLASAAMEGSDDEGLVVKVDGKTYRFQTSQLVEGGTVYITKLGGGNWKRMVAPKVKGTNGGQNMDGLPFEFVMGALQDGGSNRIPLLVSTATGSVGSPAAAMVTEGFQYPGMLCMGLMPEQPSMVKLTGVAEDRVWAPS